MMLLRLIRLFFWHLYLQVGELSTYPRTQSHITLQALSKAESSTKAIAVADDPVAAKNLWPTTGSIRGGLGLAECAEPALGSLRIPPLLSLRKCGRRPAESSP